MPGRHHLFVPGPTNIPDAVLRAMHTASEDHRSVAFPELVLPLLADLRVLFDTQDGQVLLFPASGTGGWEAALTNLLPPGAHVLMPCAGQFASLWSETARRLGYDVATLADTQWGDAPSPEAVGRYLATATDPVTAVLIVHNETSTGVTADIPALRAAIDAASSDALLLVDGVSSIASLPYHHDAWGVDVAITGSQKGLMMPAGLTLLALSRRALAATAHGARRAYFDIPQMLQQNATGYFPYTPPVPLLHGLRCALDLLQHEGMPAVFARHARLASGVRAAVAAWGLALCCREPRHYSNTVSTVMLPEGVNGNDLIAHAFRRYDLSLGGGLGPLAGRAFRIGHLGDLNEGMLLAALGLIEMALGDCGLQVHGSGLAAAQAVWQGGAA
jgi:alanine-glyoxylate transaminase/serine-glyoxylate transaminase/serine-pyruvate transaminase